MPATRVHKREPDSDTPLRTSARSRSLSPVVTFADHDVKEIRKLAQERRHERNDAIDPLLVDETAHGQQHEIVRRQRGADRRGVVLRSKTLEVDGRLDDADFRRGNTRANEQIACVFADGNEPIDGRQRACEQTLRVARCQRTKDVVPEGIANQKRTAAAGRAQ